MINVRESIILTSCFFYVNSENFSGVSSLKLNTIYFVHHCRDVKICKETNRISPHSPKVILKVVIEFEKKFFSCFAPLTVWHKVFPVFSTIRKKVRSPKKIPPLKKFPRMQVSPQKLLLRCNYKCKHHK